MRLGPLRIDVYLTDAGVELKRGDRTLLATVRDQQGRPVEPVRVIEELDLVPRRERAQPHRYRHGAQDPRPTEAICAYEACPREGVPFPVKPDGRVPRHCGTACASNARRRAKGIPAKGPSRPVPPIERAVPRQPTTPSARGALDVQRPAPTVPRARVAERALQPVAVGATPPLNLSARLAEIQAKFKAPDAQGTPVRIEESGGAFVRRKGKERASLRAEGKAK